MWRGGCIQTRNVFWVQVPIGVTSSRMGDHHKVFSDTSFPNIYTSRVSIQPYPHCKQLMTIVAGLKINKKKLKKLIAMDHFDNTQPPASVCIIYRILLLHLLLIYNRYNSVYTSYNGCSSDIINLNLKLAD